MWNRGRQTASWLLPTLALGLYCGRIASEQWAHYYAIGAVGSILLTALLLAFAYVLVHPHPLSQTWPLLLLSLYLAGIGSGPRAGTGTSGRRFYGRRPGRG